MKREETPTPRAQAPNRSDLGVVDALVQLSFLVQGALGRIAAENDLSMIQARLLGVLRDRSPGMNELARYLELDKSSVTGLVDRAEKRGLVRRRESSADRRVVEVSITAAGRKLVQRAEGEFSDRIAALVDVLTKGERAALSETASRIVMSEARKQGLAATATDRKADE